MDEPSPADPRKISLILYQHTVIVFLIIFLVMILWLRTMVKQFQTRSRSAEVEVKEVQQVLQPAEEGETQ